MTVPWAPKEFKVAINMAGAISAGAYTAGVLDFLIEALEEWQKVKDALRAYLTNPSAAPPQLVPLHDLSIEIFTGASAGGMCAAIASVMVQQEFMHIHTAQETNTNNTFYESWVNTIDIRELLRADDLANGGRLVSLLDCTIIDRLAQQALTPAASVSRPFISPRLTLMLTLTNVRGVPYQLYEDPDPGVAEFIEYFGDKLCFQVVRGGIPSAPDAKPLPAGTPDVGAWPLLQEAGKATGAFPIFLAPRILTRDVSDYRTAGWKPACQEPGPSDGPLPDFPTSIHAWQTLNVDGGVTDNNPFDLADDFLAAQNPKAIHCNNPSLPLQANCAVITVAPFPAANKFVPNYDLQAKAGIWAMLRRLVMVLVSQSRFLGESLEDLTSGVSFSRFAIAPSDPDRPDGEALQCGLLGAFGGFFERGFRAHDFLLGRRNCQKFLMKHFCLPLDNPVIAAGQASTGPLRGSIAAGFCVGAPNSEASPQAKVWMPLVPLVGSAALEVPPPARAKISSKSLNEIVGLILRRLEAIEPQLLDGAPTMIKLFVGAALTWPFSVAVKGKIRETLTAAFGSNLGG